MVPDHELQELIEEERLYRDALGDRSNWELQDDWVPRQYYEERMEL